MPNSNYIEIEIVQHNLDKTEIPREKYEIEKKREKKIHYILERDFA